jgi:hypothetical protein
MRQGEVLLIVPNRRGLWARSETTPFGHGHPYTLRQLTHLLDGTGLSLMEVHPCLFAPPLPWAAYEPMFPYIDQAARLCLYPFAGLWAVRLLKQLCVKPVPRSLRWRRPSLASAYA